MPDPKRILILGGGVGGTLVANLLSRKLGREEADITVVDETGRHTYQPGFLYLAFGALRAADLSRPERALLHDRVHLVQGRVERIDPDRREVRMAGEATLPYDYLVIATGSHLDEDAVPGLKQAGYHFYALEGAQRLYAALERFQGGNLVVGVAGVPYKCPPAPLEFAFMAEAYLRKRGLRDRTKIHFIAPLPRVFPIESVAEVVAPLMEQRGIEIHTFFNVETVDPDKREVRSLEGETVPYDLLVLIPPHRGARAIIDSGLGEGPGGWVPTDRHTMRVQGRPGVYAIGDATNLPVSKSGAAAHFEGEVVADNIVAEVRGQAPQEKYDGKVMCFLEVGDNKATVLSFDYEHPPEPPQPSWLYHVAKAVFSKTYWWTVPQGRI